MNLTLSLEAGNHVIDFLLTVRMVHFWRMFSLNISYTTNAFTWKRVILSSCKLNLQKNLKTWPSKFINPENAPFVGRHITSDKITNPYFRK